METVFIGRQPILNRTLNTYGYELLFRARRDAGTASVVDGDAATANVLINAVTEIGLNNVVGDSIAFVNVTGHYLSNPDLLKCLPPDRVVLEILEDVEPSDRVIDGIEHLAARGYTFALDDFVETGPTASLIGFADIVKYDLPQIGIDVLRARIKVDHAAGRRVVVERIETPTEHHAVAEAGADFFQGYFFARPDTIGSSGITPNTLTLIRLLAHVNDPDATLDDVVEVLTHDVAMSVRVLRFVNSAASASRNDIESITYAAIHIGLERLRSWTNLALIAAADDRPVELLTLAMTRARFCEIVARRRQLGNPNTFYTVGMLSLLDAITNTPMEDLVTQLALNDDVCAALLGVRNAQGLVLLDAVELEQHPGKRFGRHDIDLVDAHQQAMRWATGLLRAPGHD